MPPNRRPLLPSARVRRTRLSGDIETQNVLDLLAKAQLVGAGNLLLRSLGPAGASDQAPPHVGENVFEKQFPISTSPDMPRRALVPPTSEVPPLAPGLEGPVPELSQAHGRRTWFLRSSPRSENSSRTPTNERWHNIQDISRCPSRRPTTLKRILTDTARGH